MRRCNKWQHVQCSGAVGRSNEARARNVKEEKIKKTRREETEKITDCSYDSTACNRQLSSAIFGRAGARWDAPFAESTGPITRARAAENFAKSTAADEHFFSSYSRLATLFGPCSTYRFFVVLATDGSTTKADPINEKPAKIKTEMDFNWCSSWKKYW